MAKNLTSILLTSFLLLATLLTTDAVEYNVTNKAPNTPGGKLFDQLCGVPWTLNEMRTINEFIWKIFQQPNEATRKSVPVLNLYIAEFTGSMGYKDGNNIYITVIDFTLWWKPENTRYWFSSLLYHEMTHVFQWFGSGNATGTAPGGLTEGVADYVMLKSGMYDPTTYTKPGEGKNWDDGYGVTARFLEYCDSLTPNFTAKLNNMMREVYKESYFQDLLGKPLSQVWNEYKGKYGNIPADSHDALPHHDRLRLKYNGSRY